MRIVIERRVTSWTVGQRIVVGLGLASSIAIWLLSKPWNLHGWLIGAPFGRDYVNFWMAPRLVLAGQAGTLVDLGAYADTIRRSFAMSVDPCLLFVYPPHSLLLLTPFAQLPFLAALLCWTAFNLAALTQAAKPICTPPRRGLMVLVCVSPPACAMVLYGHFGGFLALASTIAVLESDRRVWLAGLCLAFLTVKPQYAAALGLILLCAGRWRCLLVAALATGALVALSVAAFGVDVWRDFVTVTMPMQSAIITQFKAKMIETAVSAYFAARFWGTPAAAAWIIQGVVAALALAFAARALRRGSKDAATVLVVLLAALVMQPYVSHYDLAIIAPALTIVLFGREGGLSPVAAAVWVLLPLARLLFLLDLPILGVLVPAMLFIQALRLARPASLPQVQPPHLLVSTT